MVHYTRHKDPENALIFKELQKPRSQIRPY